MTDSDVSPITIVQQPLPLLSRDQTSSRCATGQREKTVCNPGSPSGDKVAQTNKKSPVELRGSESAPETRVASW